MNQLSPILLVIISATLLILGDALAAKWGRNGGSALLLSLFVIPPIGYIFFGYLNASKGLAVSSGLVNVAILVGSILVGLFFFEEELSSRQWLGLCMAGVSIVLLNG